MAADRDLRCAQGCAEGRFEALNAPLYVDRAGRYLKHDGTRATYVCAVCQGVAIDVAAAAREMRRNHGGESAVVLRCPSCDTRMLPPEDDPFAPEMECPVCSNRFSVEEGVERLHGGGAIVLEADEIEVAE